MSHLILRGLPYSPWPLHWPDIVKITAQQYRPCVVGAALVKESKLIETEYREKEGEDQKHRARRNGPFNPADRSRIAEHQTGRRRPAVRRDFGLARILYRGRDTSGV